MSGSSSPAQGALYASTQLENKSMITTTNVFDRTLDDIKSLGPEAARNFMVRNWLNLSDAAEEQDGIRRDRHGRIVGSLPRNENSFSATLTTAFLELSCVTVLTDRWALLGAMSKDFSPDPYKPLATPEIKQVTAGPTVQTDPTNWESGDFTTAAVGPTMHQYSASAHITNSQLNSGSRLADATDATLASLADKVTDVVLAPMTTANFPNPLISDSASFGFGSLTSLWGQLKKAPIKNLIADGEYMAPILNSPALFQKVGTGSGGGWRGIGWDGLYLNTRWTGAGAKVRGIALHPQAIAVVAGLPLTPPRGIPGNSLGMNVISLPDLELSVALYSWFNLATRTAWMSFDIMLGVSALDTSAAVLITSP